MTSEDALIRVEKVEQRILLIRGEKVILDADLAEFYGVTTKRLNEQVKRNRDRFPEDFMFQLTGSERMEVVAKCDHLGNLKYSRAQPHAFTEHGALMAASVLNTRRAVEMSVFVVRAFVKLRHFMAGNRELSDQLEQLEKRLADHDVQIGSLIQAIRQLMSPKAVPEKRRIGFSVNEP